jgi:hypothetical protein
MGFAGFGSMVVYSEVVYSEVAFCAPPAGAAEFNASGRLTVHRISSPRQHDHVVGGREPWEYILPLKHSDFVIGASFWRGGREWRCTDIGTRTIVGICLDETEILRKVGELCDCKWEDE